jgi:hypothetical protein
VRDSLKAMATSNTTACENIKGLIGLPPSTARSATYSTLWKRWARVWPSSRPNTATTPHLGPMGTARHQQPRYCDPCQPWQGTCPSNGYACLSPLASYL